VTRAFDRLSERVRQGVVQDLGWREFRPIQEMAIEAILDGLNVLALAPTAGGKTEAAMIPVVDRLFRAGGRALYLSPLRALLNDQEDRLIRLARLGGLRSFKWHGDVGADRKRAFAADPTEILMITPESLEVILAVPRYDKPALFGNLRFVVVDEIHAFAGDDRGDHLIALLERLTEYAESDFQRIGLSATVGHPETLLSWLQGSSRREARVLRPPGSKSRRVVEIHPLGPDEEPGPLAARLAAGQKSLLFSESRGKVEKLKLQLEEGGVRAWSHHASLSREYREEAERAFREGTNCCIVCTSTMELGLDVGDLDRVLQFHAPPTVSAFLQRLGRTGRRSGTSGRLAFLTDESDSFLLACALVSLALEGWIEPVRPTTRSAHVFLHQVLARLLQRGGLTRRSLVEGVGSPWCFSGLSPAEREEILDHLLGLGLLEKVDSLLVLGREGEKKFGHANFLELYSVFETPRELRVRTLDNQEVGTLETWFAQSLGETLVFVLGGRAWVSVECDYERAVLTVKPAPRGRIPTWMGSPRLLSHEVCQAMRRLLVDPSPVPFLGPRASRCLERLRLEWGELLRPTALTIQRKGDDVLLHTYAGGKVNNVFGRLLEHRTGARVSIDNTRVSTRIPASGPWWTAIEEVLDRVRAGLDAETARALVALVPRARMSKFQPYLPPHLETALLAERLLDLDGARAVAAGARRTVETGRTPPGR